MVAHTICRALHVITSMYMLYCKVRVITTLSPIPDTVAATCPLARFYACKHAIINIGMHSHACALQERVRVA